MACPAARAPPFVKHRHALFEAWAHALTQPEGMENSLARVDTGELRSIGSVMIISDADSNKSILNADEFQRLMTVKAPPEAGSSEAANIDWARSRERLFQVRATALCTPPEQAPLRCGLFSPRLTPPNAKLCM